VFGLQLCGGEQTYMMQAVKASEIRKIPM